MGDKIICALIGAVVGGCIGAATVFLVQKETRFDSLEVKNLKITKQAVVLNQDGKETLVLRDGSVLANNTIFGKKFIGTQYQGHIFVGNRLFTSPDDLNTTPLEQWRFFTEISSSEKTGGEVVVRSLSGANVVGQPMNRGRSLRTGFDEKEQAQFLLWSNQENRTLSQVPFPVQEIGDEKTQTAISAPVTRK